MRANVAGNRACCGTGYRLAGGRKWLLAQQEWEEEERDGHDGGEQVDVLVGERLSLLLNCVCDGSARPQDCLVGDLLRLQNVDEHGYGQRGDDGASDVEDGVRARQYPVADLVEGEGVGGLSEQGQGESTHDEEGDEESEVRVEG